MSSIVDSYRPQQYLPHRKPLAAQATRTPTFTKQPQQQHSAHSRTRTASSSVFPYITTTTTTTSTHSHTFNNNNNTSAQSQTPKSKPAQPARRSLSNATSSSTTSSNMSNQYNPSLARSNSGLHRTPSNRSGNSPTSYVSLMRKQKATVWCDRSQHEDPRLLEARRQAKMRAAAEMVGGHPRNSVSTASMNSSMRSKIRHHGVPKATPYTPANISGTGVPMRLSATEVEDGESDDDSTYQTYHRRTGSDRSSLNSTQRSSYMPQSGRYSTSSTPPSNQGGSPDDDRVEDETPVPGGPRSDYFSTPTGLSGGSGGSGERENGFGELGQMPEHPARDFEAEKKINDDLRRRGSVDERTMTLGASARLFVANPDLD